MGTLLALEGAVAQGLLYAIMTLGVYITYKLLDFADLYSRRQLCTLAAVLVQF